MKKSPNPLPLPTLKLSEPPGAVRPDGNHTSLQYCLPRTVTSKINKLSPIVPITIGIMLMNSIANLAKAKSRFGKMKGSFASSGETCNKRYPEIQKLVNKKIN